MKASIRTATPTSCDIQVCIDWCVLILSQLNPFIHHIVILLYDVHAAFFFLFFCPFFVCVCLFVISKKKREKKENKANSLGNP